MKQQLKRKRVFLAFQWCALSFVKLDIFEVMTCAVHAGLYSAPCTQLYVDKLKTSKVVLAAVKLKWATRAASNADDVTDCENKDNKGDVGDTLVEHNSDSIVSSDSSYNVIEIFCESQKSDYF